MTPTEYKAYGNKLHKHGYTYNPDIEFVNKKIEEHIKKCKELL